MPRYTRPTLSERMFGGFDARVQAAARTGTDPAPPEKTPVDHSQPWCCIAHAFPLNAEPQQKEEPA